MKKIMFAIVCLASAFAVSCNKLSKDEITVQFDKKNYVMEAEADIVVKIVSSAAVESDLVVPFSISGNAELDSDYTISDKQFVIRQGTNSAEITLSPKENFGQGLKVNLALESGPGYKLGNVPVTEVSIAPKENIIWSFKYSKGTLNAEYDVVVTLTGKISGADFVAGTDYSIPFELTSESTAVLGTDFTVKDGETAFVVKKGTNSAKITLLSSHAETPDPAPVIVMTLVPEDQGRFEAGVNSEITVYFGKILSFSAIEGKWAYSSYPLYDNEESDVFLLEMMMSESGDSKEDLPKNNTSSDVIEFKTVDGANKLIPALSGDLKEFFRECEVSEFIPCDYQYYYIQSYPTWKATEVTLSVANKLFASAEQLEPAKIILHLSEDGDTLDIVIRDYVPTDFLANMYKYDGGSIYEFQPELWDQYFVFKKVQ